MSLVELGVDPAAPQDRDRYLDGLRASFGPEWGGVERFDWAFRRRCGGPAADLVTLVSPDGGGDLAGSAVTYRQLRLAAGGEPQLVGIMTGSWTRPEARGRGCFTQIVDWSRRTAARRRAAALLAFVTETNPSRRRLLSAGAADVASTYLASTPSTPPPPAAPPVVAHAGDLEALAVAAAGERPGANRFAYPDAAAWASQLLDRPDPVEVVTVVDATVVLERAPASDRVLHVSGAGQIEPGAVLAGLLARAQGSGRQLFCFTTEAAWVDAGAALGLDAGPGSITVLPSDAAADGPWVVHGGDRM